MNKFSIILFLYLSNVSVCAKVYKPFGGPRIIPTRDSVVIIDEKIGIEAQQVCGYTDWTTVAVTIPNKILSGQIFKSVGKKTVRMAKNSLLNISGAIPGLIARNISPAFGEIYNHSEIMSAWESSFSKNDCKLLSNLENRTNVADSGLRECVKKVSRENPTYTPGEARNACISSDSEAGTFSSNKKKNKNIQDKLGRNNNPISTWERIFGNSSSTNNASITLNGKPFSRTEERNNFTHTIVSGLVIKGSVTRVKAGSFNNAGERVLFEKSEKVQKSIKDVLKDMYIMKKKGFDEHTIITEIKKNYYSHNGKKFASGNNLLYRSESGESTVTAIPPALLLKLTRFINEENFKSLEKDTSLSESPSIGALDSAIRKISKDKSYSEVMNMILSLKSIAQSKCLLSQELQKAEDQINCKAYIVSFENLFKTLKTRREIELDIYEQQMKAYRFASINSRSKDTKANQEKIYGVESIDSIMFPGSN